MRPRVAWLSAFLLTAMWPGHAQHIDDPRAHARPRPGFVARGDGHFAVDGRRIQLVGATAELLQGPEPRGWTPRLVRAAGESLSVLRVWAFNDGPRRAPNPWERQAFFRLGPEGWLPDAHVALDRALAEARAAGLRVILVLGNHWAAYGGIPQYFEWINRPARGEGIPPDHETPTVEECRFFYSDARARLAYRDAVRRIVDRRNTVTGALYRDDPTILGYELMNEPRSQPAYAREQRAWNREMARYVRTLDPSHLISTGLDNAASPLEWERENWARMGMIPEIDYVDLHLYPGKTSPGNPANDAELQKRLGEVADFAHQVLRKPVVLAEVGFTPASARAFGAPPGELLARTLEDALVRHGFDAALFWLLTFDRDPWREYVVDPERDRSFFEKLRTLRTGR